LTTLHGIGGFAIGSGNALSLLPQTTLTSTLSQCAEERGNGRMRRSGAIHQPQFESEFARVNCRFR
jgi:hypothetical protein